MMTFCKKFVHEYLPTCLHLERSLVEEGDDEVTEDRCKHKNHYEHYGIYEPVIIIMMSQITRHHVILLLVVAVSHDYDVDECIPYHRP